MNVVRSGADKGIDTQVVIKDVFPYKEAGIHPNFIAGGEDGKMGSVSKIGSVVLNLGDDIHSPGFCTPDRIVVLPLQEHDLIAILHINAGLIAISGDDTKLMPGTMKQKAILWQQGQRSQKQY